MPGYKISTFSSELQRYLCPNCTFILREPIQLTCGHRLCRSCINQNQKYLRSVPHHIIRTQIHFSLYSLSDLIVCLTCQQTTRNTKVNTFCQSTFTTLIPLQLFCIDLRRSWHWKRYSHTYNKMLAVSMDWYSQTLSSIIVFPSFSSRSCIFFRHT